MRGKGNDTEILRIDFPGYSGTASEGVLSYTTPEKIGGAEPPTLEFRKQPPRGATDWEVSQTSRE
jgi:hypothetical protein